MPRSAAVRPSHRPPTAAPGTARRRPALLSGGLALLVGTTVALAPVTAAPAAAAGPTKGPSGSAFYTVPSLGGAGVHGDLIRYRPSAVSLLNLNTVSTTVMYRSTAAGQSGDPSVSGPPTAVTGTVLVPRTPWPGPGPRPIVSYAVGSQGLGTDCAASKLLEAGAEYEAAGINAAIGKGWAVAVSDYAGYTNGGGHPYIVGQTLGRNVLDIIRAATQVPGLGLSANAPVAIWGYSEGGAASSWAGQLAPSYTPGLRLAGVATGGVPTDLKVTARYLDGGAFFGFLLNAVYGLHTAYPALPFDSLINDAGRAALAQGTRPDSCLVQTLAAHPFGKLSSFVNNGLTLNQLLAIPAWSKALEANRLGKTRIDAPVFTYHGANDEVIDPRTEAAQPLAYCRLGMTVQDKIYAFSDHLTTVIAAIPDATAFLADRFAGKPARSTCG